MEYTVEREIYGGGWNIRWNIGGIQDGTWNIIGIDVGYKLERGICGLYVEYVDYTWNMRWSAWEAGDGWL